MAMQRTGPKKRAKQAAARQMLNNLMQILGPIKVRPISVNSGQAFFDKYSKIITNDDILSVKPEFAAIIALLKNGMSSGNSEKSAPTERVSHSSAHSNVTGGLGAIHSGKSPEEAGDAPSLYFEVKQSCFAYYQIKKILHNFFASQRGANGTGGMEQMWLSRRCQTCNISNESSMRTTLRAW